MATAKKAKNVTIVDVAKECGVAVSSASRILNDGGEGHRESTIWRVKKMADKLGYRPNMAARGIKCSSGIVGFLSGGHGHSYFAELQNFIMDRVSQEGYLPAFFNRAPGLTNLNENISKLLDYRVEGVITIPELSDHPADYDELLDAGVPVVAVNLPMPGEQHCDFSGTDDAAGGRLAAQHLFGLGHRRALGLTARKDADQLDFQARVKGFIDTFSSAGCNVQILRGMDELSAALENRPGEFTAVFAVSDLHARLVYEYAWRQGLRIPQDISVVGFADLDFAEHLLPPLTTLRQDGAVIGGNAVELLLRHLRAPQGKHAVTQMRITPELIIRESTAAPRRGGISRSLSGKGLEEPASTKVAACSMVS